MYENVVTVAMAADTRLIDVLHVDDELDFADVAATFIERQDERISVMSASDVEEGLRVFEQKDIDCIVSDFDMPSVDGLEFLEIVREEHPGFPFILFTGKGTEEIASQAISAGVTDYLQKGPHDIYPMLVNRILNAVEQYQARHQLLKFQKAVEHAGHAIYMTDQDGVISYVNPTFEAVTGYSESYAVGRRPTILNSGEQDDGYFQRLWKTITDGEVWYEEVVNRRRSGELYSAHQTIASIGGGNGQDGYIAIQQDISEC